VQDSETYASPYLEAYFNSKRDKSKFYGAHFYHHSFAKGPVDDINSANGTTEINLFGKAMSNSIVANGNINYENRNTYFYGYKPGTEPLRDNIRQAYDIFNLGAGIENAKLSDFNYALQGSFSYLSDHYQAQEKEFGIVLNSAYEISAGSKFALNGDVYLIDRKAPGISTKPRNLVRIKPAYQFAPFDGLWLTLGANMAVENDAIGKQKSFHVYPNLRADYQLAKSVIAYAGLTGDIDKVSLHTLSRENIWVNSAIPIFHINRSVEFLAGLKGKLGRKIAFGTGLSFANLKNLYFYQNDSADRAKLMSFMITENPQRVNCLPSWDILMAKP